MGDGGNAEGQERFQACRKALLQFFMGGGRDVLGEEVLALPNDAIQTAIVAAFNDTALGLGRRQGDFAEVQG